MDARKRRGCAALAAGLSLAAGVAACGGDDRSYANRARPASRILVTGSINTRAVAVSPARFGAGPVDLLVTNQTAAPQRVTLESVDEGAPGLEQQTAPINPRDTAHLSANVKPGRYRVTVEGDGIRAAKLVVGAARPSGQDELLQP